MSKGILYLLPCPIGEGSPRDVLPAANFEVMRSIDYFIVENVRSARRFLSRAGVASQTGSEVSRVSSLAGIAGGAARSEGAGKAGGVCEAGSAGEAEGAARSDAAEEAGSAGEMKSFDTLEFVELNEHTRPGEIEEMLAPLMKGRDAGVISEAGVPAVADPGAELVAAAHRRGIRVVPLVGPSSILLALMASGTNGQSFAFNGYLPAKTPERVRAIKHFEKRAHAERQAQIFIETPYRSGRLFADLVTTCSPETMLTVAADITARGSNDSRKDGSSADTEFIRTLTVAGWRKISPSPSLDKRPAIFIIG